MRPANAMEECLRSWRKNPTQIEIMTNRDRILKFADFGIYFQINCFLSFTI